MHPNLCFISLLSSAVHTTAVEEDSHKNSSYLCIHLNTVHTYHTHYCNVLSPGGFVFEHLLEELELISNGLPAEVLLPLEVATDALLVFCRREYVARHQHDVTAHLKKKKRETDRKRERNHNESPQ